MSLNWSGNRNNSTNESVWLTAVLLHEWHNMFCHLHDTHCHWWQSVVTNTVMFQLYLGVNDKCRDAAAYLLSRFLTRPDVRNEFLPQLIDWNLQTICMSEGKTCGRLSDKSVWSCVLPLWVFLLSMVGIGSYRNKFCPDITRLVNWV